MTGPALDIFSRDEFLNNRFSYNRDGPHITIIGPTRCGKTWLAYQLLERITTPAHPGIMLVKKPKDALIDKRSTELGYKKTALWPPMEWPWQRKPKGYTIWPITRYDPDIDRPHKTDVFRRTLLDSYKRGNRLVYVDDAYGVSEILKLREPLIELWTEFGSNNGGLMTAFQKPTHVPLWAYNQAEHLFLFHDPDKRARERFAEIGGVDPRMVQDTVAGLKRHQFLYIRRLGPAACIVEP